VYVLSFGDVHVVPYCAAASMNEIVQFSLHYTKIIGVHIILCVVRGQTKN